MAAVEMVEVARVVATEAETAVEKAEEKAVATGAAMLVVTVGAMVADACRRLHAIFKVLGMYQWPPLPHITLTRAIFCCVGRA